MENRKSSTNIIIVCILAGIIIPAYFIIYYWLKEKSLDSNSIVHAIIYSIFITCIISLAVIRIILYLDKNVPWQKNKTRRFFIEFFLTNLVAATIISVVVLLLHYFLKSFKKIEFENFNTTLYGNIVVAIVVNTIAVSIIEGQYLFRQWIKSMVEIEKLKREKAESQYAALKNQVNPHFLFNSLNSLSSLINVSPEKAIEFIDKFSKIYRYVLDVNEKIVVELREELDFLQSYYFLQKIRFGNNLEISMDIESTKLNNYIPPLSVQILIENAIKHNEVSSDYPLKIKVCTENDFLIISNNLQLKKKMDSSTGIGLKNLMEHYDHLTDARPEFFATQNEYISKIPLLTDI